MENYAVVQPKQRSGCSGCLIVVVIVGAIYLCNAVTLLIPNQTNREKWDRQQISSYQLAVNYNGFSPLMGQSEIEVRDGEVIKGESGFCSRAGDCSLLAFQSITIERMFEIPDYCVWLFPLFVCNYRYNSDYGYPESIDEICLLPFITDCGVRIQTIEFEALE